MKKHIFFLKNMKSLKKNSKFLNVLFNRKTIFSFKKTPIRHYCCRHMKRNYIQVWREPHFEPTPVPCLREAQAEGSEPGQPPYPRFYKSKSSPRLCP